METSAEWTLYKEVFHREQNILSTCQVDPFTTRLNHQLPEFIIWKPDPFAQGTDALQATERYIPYPMPDREMFEENFCGCNSESYSLRS